MCSVSPVATAAPLLSPGLAACAVDDVVSSAKLQAAGVARSTIAHRCKAGGPWRRILPGVVLLAGGEPTREQLLRGAVCQLGEGAVITGADALRAHGIACCVRQVVRLLVPAGRRVLPTVHTAPERTSRLPSPVWVRGLPFAPPARAAVDAARHEHDTRRLRALLRAPLYLGACTVPQLWAALDGGNQRGTAAIRDELRCIGTGNGLTHFGTALRVLRGSPIPEPRWRVVLADRKGREIGAVDAWWDELAVGWQFSEQYPRAGELTHLNLTGAGIVLVRTAAARLHEEPAAVRTDIAAAMRVAARRPRPVLRWRCEQA